MSLVLIADDELPTLEILTVVAEDLGYQVLEAHDGQEALALARAHQPGLVLTDHMMPGMSGVELMRALRADRRLASTPIILMSAARPEAFDEANAFLGKPIGLDQFESVLVQLLPPDGLSPAATERRSSRPVSGAQNADELLSWVAHEMKTPLSAARMSAQILQRQESQRTEGRDPRHLAMIVRQLDRMTALINSVLDAASLGEGKMLFQPQTVDLCRFVADTVGAWRELRPDVDIDLELPSAPLEVPLDRERMRQLLDNLLSNAIKYGGKSRIVVCVETATRLASIVVRDQGPGIPAGDIPHLFERFRRVEGQARSTGHGLGLYIASSLARLHGGGLSVKSELGEGTTFTVSLPVAH